MMGSDGRSKKRANSIFIRGISIETEGQDLRAVFEKYGPVYDIYVPRDYNTNKSRGFAYVEYENQEDAEKAMDKIEYLEIGGRQATLEWAKGDRKTPREMKRRYRSPSPSRRYDSHPRRSNDRYRSPDRYDSRHYRRRSPSPRRYRSPDRSRRSPSRYSQFSQERSESIKRSNTLSPSRTNKELYS